MWQGFVQPLLSRSTFDETAELQGGVVFNGFRFAPLKLSVTYDYSDLADDAGVSKSVKGQLKAVHQFGPVGVSASVAYKDRIHGPRSFSAGGAAAVNLGESGFSAGGSLAWLRRSSPGGAESAATGSLELDYEIQKFAFSSWYTFKNHISGDVDYGLDGVYQLTKSSTVALGGGRGGTVYLSYSKIF